MKKIVISFVIGLVLSAIPITGLAYSKNTFNIKRNVKGSCPARFNYEVELIPGFPPAIASCCLTGEEQGDGVSICSYNCGPGLGWECETLSQ